MRQRELNGHKVAIHTMKTDDENYYDVFVDGVYVGERSNSDAAWQLAEEKCV